MFNIAMNNSSEDVLVIPPFDYPPPYTMYQTWFSKEWETLKSSGSALSHLSSDEHVFIVTWTFVGLAGKKGSNVNWKLRCLDTDA